MQIDASGWPIPDPRNSRARLLEATQNILTSYRPVHARLLHLQSTCTPMRWRMPARRCSWRPYSMRSKCDVRRRTPRSLHPARRHTAWRQYCVVTTRAGRSADLLSSIAHERLSKRAIRPHFLDDNGTGIGSRSARSARARRRESQLISAPLRVVYGHLSVGFNVGRGT